MGHKLVIDITAIQVTPAVEAPVHAHEGADGRPRAAAEVHHHKLHGREADGGRPQPSASVSGV